MTGPSSRRARTWDVWIVQAALGLGWHAIWALALAPAAPHPPARLSAPPRVDYAAAAGVGAVAAAEDPLLVWSPTVFSLPTPAGFSRPIEGDGAEIRPSLQVPWTAVASYARTRAGGPISFLRKDSLRDDVGRRARSAGADAPLEAAFAAPRVSGGRGPTVEFLGEFSADHLVGGGDLSGAPLLTNAAWEAVAHMEFDSQGGLAHLFLEKPTDSKAQDYALIRALSRWRAKKRGVGLGGRVVVRYERYAEEPAP